MTYNPVDKFIDALHDMFAEFHDENIVNKNHLTFDEFNKLQMVRDEMDRATGHLVQMRFDMDPINDKMDSALNDLLMALDKFNELYVDEYK